MLFSSFLHRELPYLLVLLLLFPTPGNAAFFVSVRNDEGNLDNTTVQALHLSLATIGLPVPTEIRDIAEKASGNQKVSPEEADRAAATVNDMLQHQQKVLDFKMLDCHQKRQRLGEAIQEAARQVRDLAAETSAARSTIVEATSRIPQDRRSFTEFKAEARIDRLRCEKARQQSERQANDIEQDSRYIQEAKKALISKCERAGYSGFNQLPLNAADDAKQMIDHGSDVPSSEAALHGASIVAARRQEDLKNAGCLDMAAALGLAPAGSGRNVRFLQRDGQVPCKLGPHTCSAMLDIVAEVAGEVADAHARHRAASAENRALCREDDLFDKSQLSLEAAQASARVKDLAEASAKAGSVGDLTNKKDSERQKLQAELKAVSTKCTADRNDIVHGKMCTLQKLRDSLQILAGRSELPEDCQVTDWQDGVCSKTCGSGFKTLTREVIQPSRGGAACPPLKLTVSCAETVCPRSCEVSMWSSWSACSAQCDGGVQERNRAVTIQPLGNGAACPHLADMRLCNTQRCTSRCEFSQWTSWSPCSRACGGGTRTRSRGLKEEGKSSCPNAESKDRLEMETCNAQTCAAAKAHCAGDPLDVALLVDASSSMTEVGFSAVKDLSLTLVQSYSLSETGNKLSVSTFAEKATVIATASSNAGDLSDELQRKMSWTKGASNLGAALARATALLAVGGRAHASSLILLITDGRFSDPFLAKQAALKLKQSGIRLVVAVVGKEYKYDELLKSLASSPSKDNIIQLPEYDELPKFLEWADHRIITGTCSALK